MKEATKSLFSQFIENGGTSEEFWVGRREALKQANARVANHKKAAEAHRNERIAHLMERGYSKFEAEEKLRLETFEAHDAMCGNPRKRIGRTPSAKYQVSGMAF